MATRTYALKGRQPPGWMHIMPIEPFTEKQWDVMFEICRGSNGCLADELATRSRVSVSTVRKALGKMVLMGIIRRDRSGRYWRKVWRP